MNTMTSYTAPLNQGDIESAHFPASARLLVNMLRALQHGSLTVTFPDGQCACFGQPVPGGLNAALQIHDWRVFSDVMKSGDIGFAEAYIRQDWHSPHLAILLELMARNRQAMERAMHGSWWGKCLYRLRHYLNRNTRAGSKKNIHAHYDLGNAFYQLWLDPSMTYSSALFLRDQPAQSLELAQQQKYRRILDELKLADRRNEAEGDSSTPARVLEIGCGWGGFAELAAGEGNLELTGLTLSSEQLEFARQRMQKAGLAERVDLRLQDYRDMHDKYDGIASIEMFEAVGEAYWPDYFNCLNRNLRSGGRACIQSIVIADGLFERYRRGTDFIQQYIFPGGMLPSVQRFEQMAGQAGLQLENRYQFGIDYADTLALWHQQFIQYSEQIQGLGFDQRFMRTWEFYLAYCEAGFRSGDLNVVQFTLRKP